MLSLTEIKHVADYKILLVFNNGVSGILDFENILKKDMRPFIRELLDSCVFSRCRLDLDTLSWENGADFAPEFLLEELMKFKAA
jgi:hypothetical protein